MLGRFRSAVNTALDGLATITGQQADGSVYNGNYPPSPDLSLKPKYTYGRPHFLKLSPDEVGGPGWGWGWGSKGNLQRKFIIDMILSLCELGSTFLLSLA